MTVHFDNTKACTTLQTTSRDTEAPVAFNMVTFCEMMENCDSQEVVPLMSGKKTEIACALEPWA